MPPRDEDRILDGYESVCTCLESVTDDSTYPTLGDVDQNDNWDNADSQLILNFFGNVAVVPQFDPGRTDLDRNGVIDNGDAQRSLNYFGRLDPYLPVGN